MSKVSFSERMQAGKDNAANRRYKGFAVGVHASHKPIPSRRDAMSLDSLEAYYHQFRKDIHINAYCAVEWALFGQDWQDLCEF